MLSTEEQQVVGLLESPHNRPEGGQGKVWEVKPPQWLDPVCLMGGKCSAAGIGGVFLEVLLNRAEDLLLNGFLVLFFGLKNQCNSYCLYESMERRL